MGVRKASINDQTQRSFNEFSWEQLIINDINHSNVPEIKDVFINFYYLFTCYLFQSFRLFRWFRFAHFGGFDGFVLLFRVLVHAKSDAHK